MYTDSSITARRGCASYSYITEPQQLHAPRMLIGAPSCAQMPPNSTRLYAPFVLMLVFTALFLVLVRREWVLYVSLRHEWLARSVQLYLTLFCLVRRSRAHDSTLRLASARVPARKLS